MMSSRSYDAVDILTTDEWALVSLMLQQVHAAGPPYDADDIHRRLVEYFGAVKGDAVMARFWSLDDEGESDDD